MACLLLLPTVTCWNGFLSLARPFWLPLPIFIYTPLIYTFLPFAWLLVVAFMGYARLIRLSTMTVLTITGLMLHCVIWVLFSPIFSPELPYLGANGKLTCHYENPPVEFANYICDYELRGSEATHRTYEFAVSESMPFIILLRTDFGFHQGAPSAE